MKKTISVLLTLALILSCWTFALADEKPVDAHDENPIEEPVENPDDNPGDNPVENPDDNPGEEPDDNPEERNIVITLDPGHGPVGGAVFEHDGVTYYEYELVLKIAYYLKAELETYDNVQVYLTRETNEKAEYKKIYELEDRCKIAEDNHSDVFVSLHLNGSDLHNASGACVLIPSGSYRPKLAATDKLLADCILKYLWALGIGARGNGYLIRYSESGDVYPDGSPADYYGIIRGGILMGIPTVLIEHCFLDSRDDFDNFLSTEDKLKALAHADALGIMEYVEKVRSGEIVVEVDEPVILPFTDVAYNAWYRDDVVYVYSHGLMVGTSETTFAPNTPMTRAMFAQLLYNLEGNPEVSVDDIVFTDVKSTAWYAPAISWAYQNELIFGVSETKCAPNDVITREQMATLLFRYAQFKGYDITARDDLEDFSDTAKISGYAEDAFRWAVAEGIIEGVGGGILKPKGDAERCQIAAMMQRFLEKTIDE